MSEFHENCTKPFWLMSQDFLVNGLKDVLMGIPKSDLLVVAMTVIHSRGNCPYTLYILEAIGLILKGAPPISKIMDPLLQVSYGKNGYYPSRHP